MKYIGLLHWEQVFCGALHKFLWQFGIGGGGVASNFKYKLKYVQQNTHTHIWQLLDHKFVKQS